MISFRKVQVKTPQGKVLVHETSFEVPKSTIVGLYGPNGSGKSSLLRTLAGQLSERDVSGECWIEQTPIFQSSVSISEKARRVLYLGSDFQTSFHVSVRELLDMAKHTNPKSNENGTEVAEKFGITKLLSRSFNEMSDGEKQRVMLARGVIQSPDWLILDETFSKIDLDHSFHLVNELKNVVKKGKGIVLASHDLNLISEFVDELWLMKDGKVVASGLIEEVLTSENMEKLYPNRIVHVVRSPDNGKKKVIY